MQTQQINKVSYLRTRKKQHIISYINIWPDFCCTFHVASITVMIRNDENTHTTQIYTYTYFILFRYMIYDIYYTITLSVHVYTYIVHHFCTILSSYFLRLPLFYFLSIKQYYHISNFSLYIYFLFFFLIAGWKISRWIEVCERIIVV